jgi:membrane-bound ClpP family serine protease
MGRRLVNPEPPQEENIGIDFYLAFGRIFIGVGVVFLLILGGVLMMPQDYEKYNIPLMFGIMFAMAFIIIIIGIVVVVLCKKSKRFQAWAEKDVTAYAKYLINKEIEKDAKRKK